MTDTNDLPPMEFKVWKQTTSGNEYVQSYEHVAQAKRRAYYLLRKNYEKDLTLVTYFVTNQKGDLI
jgi:hypothetical protein